METIKMELKEIFGESLSAEMLIELPPLALAFVGDGIHTMYVRNNIVKTRISKIGDYHSLCAKFCKADCQAKVLDAIMETLTEVECDVVRRARNVKTHNIAKNADGATYKKATSFEALIGYLYLTKQHERMNQILDASVM